MPSMVKWSKVSKVAQSCLTLCDPMNCSLPVHGIFQARVLEWVAISFPRSSSQPRDQTQVYLGFSRQEYWSGLPFPSPGHLPNPGIKPRSTTLQADTLPLCKVAIKCHFSSSQNGTYLGNLGCFLLLEEWH